ncbi:MAG: thioredoxin family protein [Candidatus Lokiarchaeota archaeon]|nr:thioredoxin family protein [Candidatus Lokiarchaeota archaeon]
MIFPKKDIDKIKRELAKLKAKVVLKLFTDFKTLDDGSKKRTCIACEGTYNLLNSLEELSNGKFSAEEISIEESPEEAIKYNVTRIPAILFINDKGKEIIRYSAYPTGSEFDPFLSSIQHFSGIRPSYTDQILTHLKKIDKSEMKIFITPTCPYCPATVPVLTLFAIVSKGKITAEVIDVSLNPDIARKYEVQGVPLTVVNESERIVGMFTPQDLLDKLTKGQRDFGGMYA